MKITSADFIKSAFEKSGWPESELPEIAFAGRSNVGKSSLINSLVNRKGLVKTSSAPGKTRSLNFFDINQNFIFTDLPGYGYAKGHPDEIRKWKPMVENYLKDRNTLRALVHIVDIRRKPDELEMMITRWASGAGMGYIVVANKSDKLSKSKCKSAVLELEKAFECDVILFSAKTGAGRKELWSALRPFLRPLIEG